MPHITIRLRACKSHIRCTLPGQSIQVDTAATLLLSTKRNADLRDGLASRIRNLPQAALFLQSSQCTARSPDCLQAILNAIDTDKQLTGNRLSVVSISAQ